ncbi:hypothetical protein Tco_0410954 [Tanacetum coccineum]
MLDWFGDMGVNKFDAEDKFQPLELMDSIWHDIAIKFYRHAGLKPHQLYGKFNCIHMLLWEYFCNRSEYQSSKDIVSDVEDVLSRYLQIFLCNQVLRIVSQWSAGTGQVEESIHKAYCSFIEKAEHFIYIKVGMMKTDSRYLLAANMADHTAEAKAIFFDDAATVLIGTGLMEPPIKATGTHEYVQGRRLWWLLINNKLPERPTSSDPYADMSRVLSQAVLDVDEYSVVPRGTAAPVLLKWFVSRDVPTGAPSSNGTIIPIPIPSFPLLVYLHSRKFIRSTDGAKSGVLVRASRPILLPDIIGRSSSETRARKALFRFVPVLHFLLIEKKGDFSYLESFCGVLRLLFFRTFFSLPRDRSAKRERARRRKGQPNGNEQGRNDKMRCPGHPHLERRVEVFGPVALPVPPSSGGACVGGAPAEIGLEALTLPTSRQLMAVGHDYYKKAPMKMNISHGGVCIFMLGVLLSCDPAAYVRPVAHASYLFRAGGVNSDSIRVTPVGEVALSIPSGQPGREHGGDGLPKKPARAGAWARKQEAMAFALVGAIKHLRLFHSILKLDRKVETFRGILFLRDALLRYDGLFDSLSAPLLLLSCEWGVEYSESTGLVGKPKKSRDKEQSRNKEPEGKSKRDMDQILLPQNTRALRDGFKLCSDKGIQVNDIESDSKVMVDSILDKATQLQTDWLLMLTLTGLIASLKRLLFSCKQAYYNDKEGLDSYSCSRNAFFHQSHAVSSVQKITAIEESKDLSSLSLDELIGNIIVYEVIMEKDFKVIKGEKEKVKSLTLKAKKDSIDDESSN